MREQTNCQNSHSTLRVLIADDSSSVLNDLSKLLSSHREIEVIGSANNGEEAVELAAELLPDVVITDVDMPDGDGLDVVRLLRARLPSVKVIVISGHTSQGYEKLARDEGALAFIPKTKLSLDALSQALQGEG